MRHGACDERAHGGVVPTVLSGERGGAGEQREHEQRAAKTGAAHRRAISGSLRTAASIAAAVAVAACADATSPTTTTLTTDQLLVLGLQSTAPAPTSATKWISNQSGGTLLLTHPDGNLTLYAQVDFPPDALSTLDGQRLTTTDSVMVTVTPRTDGYGITVSPNTLSFTLGNTPTVTFAFARYADPSVASGDATYPDVQSYVSALGVWYETTIDHWKLASGSGSVGNDEVSAGIDAPGTFVLAAPK